VQRGAEAVDSVLRTVDGDDAARLGEDAHGADILLAQRVLHAGEDGTAGRQFERGAGRVGERVARVEGLVVVGHGYGGRLLVVFN